MEFECEKDRGKQPSVINLRKETCQNTTVRTSVWTGEHLQITVMSIPVGGEIGLERHEELDQLLYIESGFAKIYMGKTKETIRCLGMVSSGTAVLIPACTWHNLVNVQNIPVKMFSVYAPPQHPFCTVHKTKADTDHAE